ncbi:cob(I)yrinic acid a,c-diamide adenosyltransferase, mitochondrial [Agrilus planipennis]|uniref:Cob(I)yrinic acid a,c-diamide adenosyltransferase, mitochondrial n=1 Tax=Agrilus planipennis TaxID=224129 RepID=A0A1W4XCM8_AGRPL|nr:cob(I)yrinic acid a,c-diamide adenosyltransferase, mitochondrial [Agrilus planipennis]
MISKRFLPVRSIFSVSNFYNRYKRPQLVSYSTSNSNEPVYKEGDLGTSKVLTGEVLSKDHFIFNAIGATEELLSYLGLAREHALENNHEYCDKIKRIQTVIIDISTAISNFYGDKNKQNLSPNHKKELEDWIINYSKQLPPPEQYIIPGSGVASASLHVARAICRRTERVITPLVRDGGLDKEALIYLNRLADFLFTISRIAAKLDKRNESIYIPPKPDEKIQAQASYFRKK